MAGDNDQNAINRHNLEIANRYVERKRQALDHRNVSVGLEDPYHRSTLAFHPGDQWDVLAFHSVGFYQDHGIAGAFRYRVVDVAPAPLNEVTLEITQLNAYGLKKIDPNVASIRITLDRDFREIRKTYHFIDNKAAQAASPGALLGKMSVLEGFPLDAVNIHAAFPIEVPGSPNVPAALTRLTRFSTDGQPGIWLDTDDVFGRQVRIFWPVEGKWPLYLENSRGVSIRVGSGANS